MILHYPTLSKYHYLLLLLICAVSAQSQDIASENSYGGKNAELLFDAIPTPDSGFLLAGSSISDKDGTLTDDNRGDFDYWVWKMDANGVQVWQKRLGGSGMDLLQKVQVTTDGGYILAGISASAVGFDKKDACKGNTDFWIIKLDINGGELWQKTIGGSGQEKVNSIIQTADGGYIIAGSSNSNKTPLNDSNEADPYGKSEDSHGNLDFWVVKLHADGSVAWQKTIGGKYVDELKTIVQTTDGGYLLGGYSNSPISGNKTESNIGIGDYWIVKLNNTGGIQWQKTLGGDKDDILFALTQTQDGGFVIGGVSNSSATNAKSKGNTNGTDIWVVKLNDQGNIAWQETYDYGQYDVVSSIVENPDGSFLMGGYAQSETSHGAASKGFKVKGDKEGINDYVASKISAEGEQIWKQSVGSKGDEVLKKLYVTADGGYLLAGTSKGGKSRDKNTNIGGSDFWLVKLKDKAKPKKPVDAVTAYPNPTQNTTNVAVTYDYTYGTAILYDLNGRQLQTTKLAGEKNIPFNLGNLPRGIYVISIKTNNGVNAVKVMKQ